ncbi:UNVERIFIED_CONTAM: hypothetical protein LK11_23045 [Mumia flava]
MALLLTVLLTPLAGCAAGTSEEASDAATATAPATRGSLGSDVEDAVAVEAADRVVGLWARPDLPPAQWAAELRPHLSVVAQSAMAYVDPSTLPDTEPSGESFVTSGAELQAVVVVPTDAGDFRVSLSRRSEDSNWSADRVRSPGDS